MKYRFMDRKIATFVVAFSALLALTHIPVVHAAGQTCTWVGTKFRRQ